MHENEIATEIVDSCFHIHKELGPDLLESVYEGILCFELHRKGLTFSRQQPIPVIWKELKLEFGFRMDILVENKVIVEIKSVENLNPVYMKILLTYLKLADKRLGLLVNFNETLIKEGIHRVVDRL